MRNSYFTEFCEREKITLAPEVVDACLFLEQRGLVFCGNFGYENAVEIAGAVIMSIGDVDAINDLKNATVLGFLGKSKRGNEMSKLNELLSVEADLRSQAESCLKDLKNTFEKKRHHFTEKVVTFKSSVEGTPDKIESQLSLQTTVSKELEWIGEKLGKALDGGHQIDAANTQAKADIVLEDGKTLLSGIPATSLLRLEHRIKELRDLIHTIPTLDPAQGFAADPARGAGIFKAREIEKIRTQKVQKHVIVVQPTKEHPAQVALVSEDIPVGQIHEQEWSSLITVAEKGDMLDRVEDLLRAIKKAKSRANDVDVDVKQNKIGSAVLNFVFHGK